MNVKLKKSNGMKVFLVFGLPILIVLILAIASCNSMKDHDDYDSY